MPVGGDYTSDPPVIEGEGAEVFADQDNGKPLILIRAKRPGRHD